MTSEDGILAGTVRLMVKGGFQYRDAMHMFRKALLVAYLRESVNGRGRPNKCRVARELGMHRNTLDRQIEELGISIRGWKVKAKP